jgi:molybdopterin converting factor small subunit
MHHVNLDRLRRLASGGSLTIRVPVQMFGHYTDFVGHEPFELDVRFGATIADLATALASRDARLADIGSHCRFAIDEEYAGADARLTEGSLIAVLPPMSGG